MMNKQATADWEAAYLRFETPKQEVEKFRRRLVQFGVEGWPQDLNIVELFCGRGNGLKAWETLGFTNIVGIDLSDELIRQVDPKFKTLTADARELPLSDESVDVISINGGLHHLPQLPEDLERVLLECRRVLRSGGQLLIVEPWMTPFLRFVHFCCKRKRLRTLWPRLEALATMIELEKGTYFSWLAQPKVIQNTLGEAFPNARMFTARGKLRCSASRG